MTSEVRRSFFKSLLILVANSLYIPRTQCDSMRYADKRRIGLLATYCSAFKAQGAQRHIQRPWTAYQARHFGVEAIPAFLVPPIVFGGLFVTLWTYKCLMMVAFQNKIIYMPSVPPFSRSETVGEYAAQCRPVVWTEHDLRSTDGTALKVLEGCLGSAGKTRSTTDFVIMYLQGNASSLPPRLPYLSRILKAIVSSDEQRSYSIVALSYRGFWKSRGSPSQNGIERDAEAALHWVGSNFNSEETKIILWGQSIGAGVATTAFANVLRQDSLLSRRVVGLLLETPFVDLKAMLVALYPQRFLPYRYLTPFLFSTWDSKKALRDIGSNAPCVKTLMLEAGDDEIVPSGQAAVLEQVCRDKGLPVERRVVPRALHTEVAIKPAGRRFIVEFLCSF